MGLLAALALIAVMAAYGQDTATLTGRAMDPTGAVVIGAQVTVVNTATNVESSTVTNRRDCTVSRPCARVSTG